MSCSNICILSTSQYRVRPSCTRFNPFLYLHYFDHLPLHLLRLLLSTITPSLSSGLSLLFYSPSLPLSLSPPILCSLPSISSALILSPLVCSNSKTFKRALNVIVGLSPIFCSCCLPSLNSAHAHSHRDQVKLYPRISRRPRTCPIMSVLLSLNCLPGPLASALTVSASLPPLQLRLHGVILQYRIRIQGQFGLI